MADHSAGPVTASLLSRLGSTILSLVTFSTITVPATFYAIFSMTFTITLNFTTVLVISAIFFSAAAWIARYRLLTVHSRQTQEPQQPDPQIGFLPPTVPESKAKFSNYLEELFSEIFGYLEPFVFRDLIRQLQTRKLIAGETLLLEKETGFCLVVDGEVQILTRCGSNCDSDDDNNDHVDAKSDFVDDADTNSCILDNNAAEPRYQLISEVRSGVPLSSLFSILSLFSEEIEPWKTFGAARSQVVIGPAPPSSRLSGPNQRPPGRRAFEGTAGTESTSSEPSPVHPEIIARALVDTTVAIIPASSFRRLTRTHPKAAAHIVQVILTRFTRATLGTAQRYLGLTNEVSRLERDMNHFTTVPLPMFLHGSSISRLKSRFSSVREKTSTSESSGGIALHNPRTAHRRHQNSHLSRPDLALQRAPSRRYRAAGPHELSDDNWKGVSPGDLFGRIPHAKVPTFGIQPSRPAQYGLSESDEGDENEFRQAIMGAMCQALGIFRGNNDPAAPSPGGAGTPASFVPKQGPVLGPVHANILRAPPPYRSATPTAPADTPALSSAFMLDKGLEHAGLFGHKPETEIDSNASVSASAAASVSVTQGINDNLVARLLDDVEIVFFPRGSMLVEEGERTPGLYYVIDGFLEVGVSGATANTAGGIGATVGQSTTNVSAHLIKPGGLAGYLGSVSNHRSLSSVTAKSDVLVGFLSRAATERLVDGHPAVLLALAKRLTTLLPPTILHVDFAVEWIQMSAGGVVFEQGAESDAIYIVLNGRLRTIQHHDGLTSKSKETSIIDEYGQGDSIGELEVLTSDVHPASLRAIRDSELVRLPRTLFHSLASIHPNVSLSVSRTIARRMQRLVRDAATGTPKPASVKFRTIAIVPISAGVPIGDFATRLTAALIRTGTPNGVASLSQTTILEHLGRHVFSRMGKLKLSQYLADLEEKFGLVLYVADSPAQSPWTSTCINKADCILLVARADSPARVSDYERLLPAAPTTVKELVLIHSGNGPCPHGLTRRWLQNRPWITSGHHHIRMPIAGFAANPRNRKLGDALRKRVQELQTSISRYTANRMTGRPVLNLISPDTDPVLAPETVQPPLYAENSHRNDFLRLARHLRGKSIGLVLGGGGARGIAHVGVLRAFDEAGIPIDIVGGTSIGAFVGALYAADADVLSTFGKAKKFSGRMNSVWRFVLDLTYPTAAYTTGLEFNRSIFKSFGNARIEDFRLPFYCNSTNISNSRQEIHDSGFVWRYVRASMTLAGLIPPLCDQGRMLLDGGYVDNLTVQYMSKLGTSVIFAVDVGSLDDETPQRYGDSLSGLWTVFNRWNPFSNTPNPPSLSEIQTRLAYVSSVDALVRAKNTPGCYNLRPEIDPFGTLEFGRFEEIEAVGYRYGTAFIEQLREKGEVPGGLAEQAKWPLRRTPGRRASI